MGEKNRLLTLGYKSLKPPAPRTFSISMWLGVVIILVSFIAVPIVGVLVVGFVQQALGDTAMIIAIVAGTVLALFGMLLLDGGR